MTKKVLILGSTGSIGTQALEIIRNNRDKFSVAGLSCRSRVDTLIEQIREFRPEAVCVGSAEDAERVKGEFPEVDVLLSSRNAPEAVQENRGALKGEESEFGGTYDAGSARPDEWSKSDGLVQLAQIDCDMVLNALMGISGLAPTCAAIKCGRDIALANKETLVAGGELVTELCREHGVRLLPVDSEHSAIFQCLEGNGGSACARAYRKSNTHNYKFSHEGKKLNFELNLDIEDDAENEAFRPIRRILLTASGGPFRGRSYEELKGVTVEQALNHPNWSMGAKITVDSATMMNKGLEVIEARWLFDVPADKIDVHVHPESIVHSMVEFMDGSVIAQMGLPDMKIPIGLALNYPDRLSMLPEFDAGAACEEGSIKSGEGTGKETEEGCGTALDFFTMAPRLTFEKPDRKTFRCLDIAYAAIKEGGSAPVIMNGANEELVAMFLEGKIRFTDIPETLEKVLNAFESIGLYTVEEILETDRLARAKVRELIG